MGGVCVSPAVLLLIILLGTLALFVWGKWRYDVVAFIALAAVTACGMIPYDRVFSGFSNPAVITVVCVMMLSEAISLSGILDFIVRGVTPLIKRPTMHIAVLCILAAVLSAFMNNIGALAIVLPIALKTSRDSGRSPSLVLMPIAFASALGGLLTVIGTPPNILISAYRETLTGHAYNIFDFTTVGGAIALASIIFIIVAGWRLVPERIKSSSKDADDFSINGYLAELKIQHGTKFEGISIDEFEKLCNNEVLITGVIRNKRKHLALSDSEILHAEDILIVEADPKDLEKLINKGGVDLVLDDSLGLTDLKSDKVQLLEAVIPAGSYMIGRTIKSMRLRYRFQLTCLAFSRQGTVMKARLRDERLRAGDVLLLQGDVRSARENIVSLELLPLAERDINIGSNSSLWMPITIFMLAIACAAFKILPIEISFMMAVLILVLTKNLPLRNVYSAIEWPIIMLLGAMIPVGQAMQTTGGTKLITQNILLLAPHLSPAWLLAGILLITMTLSDLMNNAATAVVMAPIAANIAQSLHVSVDPFLMAVAIGASCSFLTPIGHQNNTLVMGPGGYKFTDYLRLGLPIEIIIMLIAVPMLMHVWPM